MSNLGSVKKSNRWIPTETRDLLLDIIRKEDNILKVNPTDLYALKKKGVAFHKLSYLDHKYREEAMRYFDEILRLDPSNKEFLIRKGVLLLKEKTGDQANQCFDKILSVDPNDSEALWGKGMIALQIEKKPYQAVSYFDKALTIDPSDAQVWLMKGFALSARGETWGTALECFDKAIEINSDDPRSWSGKGKVLQKKNELDKAISCYDQALRLEPKNWDTLMFKGFALTGKGNFGEAINCFDESLGLKKDNIEALRGKADALYLSDNFEQADSIYEIIIKLDEKYYEAWRQKAFCLLKLNKKEEALNDFKKVLEINPDDIKTKLEIQKLTGSDKERSIFTSAKNQGSDNYAIVVKKINKKFKIYHEKKDTVFSLASSFLSKNRFEIMEVLHNVSFDLKKGEMLGIIGKNGSGKTTLLRILSGILKPDSGEVKINGTVAPLLQLGTGFQGELTARENIVLSGMLAGFSKKEMLEKIDSIIKFAELERFADTKIRNFSSGMYARLAFATSIQIDPDILLVDEVLAVGDINFVKKSYREFLSFREKGKSIVFVSHSLDHIRNLCDRAMILDAGEIKIIGNTDQVIEHYIQSNN